MRCANAASSSTASSGYPRRAELPSNIGGATTPTAQMAIKGVSASSSSHASASSSGASGSSGDHGQQPPRTAKNGQDPLRNKRGMVCKMKNMDALVLGRDPSRPSQDTLGLAREFQESLRITVGQRPKPTQGRCGGGDPSRPSQDTLGLAREFQESLRITVGQRPKPTQGRCGGQDPLRSKRGMVSKMKCMDALVLGGGPSRSSHDTLGLAREFQESLRITVGQHPKPNQERCGLASELQGSREREHHQQAATSTEEEALAEQQQEIVDVEKDRDAQRNKTRFVGQPQWLEEVKAFQERTSKIECTSWDVPAESAWKEWVPVPCLHWTRDVKQGSDTDMMDEHDRHEGQSVYETVDQLWQGALRPEDIEPLVVVLHSGKLWSLSNRRLAALKMYQAWVGHKLIWIRCIVRDPHHPKFDSAMPTHIPIPMQIPSVTTADNDGKGILPNTTDGHPSRAQHYQVLCAAAPVAGTNHEGAS